MSVSPSININILQGADFTESFLSKETDNSATDLTGYSGYSQLKKHGGATSSHAFTVGITSTTGEVEISMTGSQTSNIEPGRYVYDVKLVSGSGDISRLVEGMAFVSPGITTAG